MAGEQPLVSAYPGQDEHQAREIRTGRARRLAVQPELQHITELHDMFEGIAFSIGVTAVHGVEPQQIAANILLLGLNELRKEIGLEPMPILIPYVPGHPSYGARTIEVLKAVYQDQAHLVYLSEDLGRALAQTEFGMSGYQHHWREVVEHQPQVQTELMRLVNTGFTGIRLDQVQETIPDPKVLQAFGSDEASRQRYLSGVEARKQELTRLFTIPEGKRALEINAGANVSAATESKRVVSHFYFPVTLDGLVEYVKAHRRVLDYEPRLLHDMEKLAYALRSKFETIGLPDLHALLQEPWFEALFTDVYFTPPLKERLIPPSIQLSTDSTGKTTLTIETTDQNGKPVTENVEGFNRDRGIIYMNISGSGWGAESGRQFLLDAALKGYTAAAPRWLIEDVWGIPRDPKLLSKLPIQIQEAAKRVIRIGPEILFAKDESGKNLCVAFFMRPGMGSYAYAQLAEVPILFAPFETLDNVEMRGIGDVLVKQHLGRRYTGRDDSIKLVQKLAPNIATFNQRVYQSKGIPRDMEAIRYAALIIAYAEVLRLTQEQTATIE